MADIKISELPAAAPLDGSEEVPIVQGGSTVRTTLIDVIDISAAGLKDFGFVRSTAAHSVTITTYTVVDAAFDISLDAAVGDVIEFELSAVILRLAAGLVLSDVATMVAGSPVTWFSSGTGTGLSDGLGAYYADLSTVTSKPVGGSVYLVLGAGDIAGGTTTVRLFAKKVGANNQQIGGTTLATFVAAKNLGPVPV